MLKIIRAKLHGIFVTGADLNYHGSITLDSILCKTLKIYPLEFVEIWNKNNGVRFSTYVIYGEAYSRCCVLNGAAARNCQKDDELIIAAYKFCQESEIENQSPKILTFNKDNTVNSVLEYNVKEEGDWYKFSIDEITENLPFKKAS
ncbi:MAG: aspartate 1-decarboxylase [Alphaproteobacteria bacterium]|nr:aspartate 1-decarboxylase [Alphaproteobacteria bacterium]